MSNYHQPVLLHESIEGLNITTGGIYVDVTFGGGGHSKEIIKNIGSGKLIAFDQDKDAIANKIEDDRFVLVHANFSYLKQFLQFHAAPQVDGILADLGVSSHQFDTANRGFSIRFEGALDMRMNNAAKLSAANIVAEYSVEQLQLIFSQYGEIINSKTLAQTIFEARKKGAIKTTTELKLATEECVRGYSANDYYAKVFQALRIEVNDELGALKKFLEQTVQVMKPGARLVVISYHSLEDRLVKNFIRTGTFDGVVEKDLFGKSKTVLLKAINKKPIVPTEQEIKSNNRARSAKMRIAEKI
ncbi:MAG: 16S rRNA (cytosine(1402)-N(4))-methyltransferase RsmH [Bacteroidetes bacterium]|nr:16S rRNA (cytosine(1402)-N(4))-methyltransferase RsmH [Bacteroidota bacterium]